MSPGTPRLLWLLSDVPPKHRSVPVPMLLAVVLANIVASMMAWWLFAHTWRPLRVPLAGFPGTYRPVFVHNTASLLSGALFAVALTITALLVHRRASACTADGAPGASTLSHAAVALWQTSVPLWWTLLSAVIMYVWRPIGWFVFFVGPVVLALRMMPEFARRDDWSRLWAVALPSLIVGAAVVWWSAVAFSLPAIPFIPR